MVKGLLRTKLWNLIGKSVLVNKNLFRGMFCCCPRLFMGLSTLGVCSSRTIQIPVSLAHHTPFQFLTHSPPGKAPPGPECLSGWRFCSDFELLFPHKDHLRQRQDLSRSLTGILFSADYWERAQRQRGDDMCMPGNTSWRGAKPSMGALTQEELETRFRSPMKQDIGSETALEGL